MTKKIVWRLKEQPTSKMLQELVSSGILTKDEAREILFNETEESERSINSFKEEIKFLREIIEKLSSREKIVEVVRGYSPFYLTQPYVNWYQPYYYWTATNAINAITNAITKPGGSGNSTLSTCSFSDISTF